ncbi:MAG TPA: hybrid sensor histidine kinase/response regulator, partial [Thioploca sp.]|nr:hybrid sensor histidine kinase/response regulator [Thioploca sp.]
MDTLLVVDDIPDNLRLLLNFLGKQGFKVLIGQDGKEAINTAEFAQPDLILLDVMMPGMDGFEVCKTLKNNETTKDIPIIFMTARTDSVDKLKGFELGAADYIGKPFEQEEVLARINTQLKLHKLHQQLLAEINRRKQAEISWQADRDGLAKSMVELRQLNADLTHATQVKDEFLANMSHELRAPLYVIFTISESLQEKNYGPLNDKQYQHIQTLKESGQHLLDLINDILDLAKIEADQLTLNIDTFSVNDVCEASLRMTKELAYKKRIRVLTTQDDMVGTIQADARRLKQILVNLLSNAVKFTPESGSIKLVVNGDVEHGMVDFSVEDTGMGIAENDRKRLFEPFVQLDSSLNQVQEGTGLGLSLVYRLTEMHGGSVSV